MKKLLIKIIKWYQRAPFSSHIHCRYVPTCSAYAIEALENYGIVYGLYLSIRRILKCNPLHKAGLDPVPIKKKEREIL